MTDIPGTGKIQTEIEKEMPEEPTKIINTVNIKEIKKKNWQREKPEDKVWYNTLWAWGLFGVFGGLVFVILALINERFLILSPIGPIAGVLAWFITKLARRFENQKDPKKLQI